MFRADLLWDPFPTRFFSPWLVCRQSTFFFLCRVHPLVSSPSHLDSPFLSVRSAGSTQASRKCANPCLPHSSLTLLRHTFVLSVSCPPAPSTQRESVCVRVCVRYERGERKQQCLSPTHPFSLSDACTIFPFPPPLPLFIMDPSWSACGCSSPSCRWK